MALIRFAVVRPTLVGRSREIDRLVAAARAVAGGAGGCLHLVGEPGIGKTSLLAVAADELANLGVPTTTSASDETDRRRRLTMARTLWPDLDRDDSPDVGARVVAAAERSAARGPFAVLVDDVHWADDASVDGLRFVARRARDLGLLVITAARVHPTPPALRRLDDWVAGDGGRVVLERLADDDLDQLVASVVGAPPGPGLRALLAGSAGNPFLTVEVVEALRRAGDLVHDDGHVEVASGRGVPDEVGRRLATRTLGVVPDGDLLLRAGAVLPGGFTAEELAELVGRPLTDVLGVAMAAIDAAVLVDTGTTLAFRHDLLRRAVLDATPTSIVRTLQRQAAEVLSRRRADPERITTCLLAGADPTDPADIERLRTTAAALRERNAGASADLLRLALTGMPIDAPETMAAALELGWALVAAARPAEVVDVADRFLARAAGVLRVHRDRLVGNALSLDGQLDAVETSVSAIGPGSVPDDVAESEPAVIDAAAELCLFKVASGRLDDARALLAWVDTSETERSPFRRATVATTRAYLHGVEGRYEDAVTEARTALSLAAADRDAARSPGSPAMALAMALDALGDGDGALAQLHPDALPADAPRWMPPLLQCARTLTLFRSGAWDDALAEAEAAFLATEEVGRGLVVFWPFAVKALVACARDDVAGAAATLALAQERQALGALGSDWLLAASAFVKEAEGDTAMALALFDLTVRACLELDAPQLALAGGPELVRLALDHGDDDAVARVVTALDRLAARTASPVVAAHRVWVHGWVAGDPPAAVEAATRLAAVGRHPEATRAWRDAAVLAARGGLPDVAREHARHAFVGMDALDASRWHAQLRADLRAAGISMRPRHAPARATHGWDSLTESERTIVGLVGEGLTNSDIGARLFVSRRTVESHLGRVYTKLGLSTRAQLVAEVVRRAD